jgi:hypothetical protein
MANNYRMDGTNVQRVQDSVVGYAGDITIVYH